MLDANEIRNQTFINSENVTREEATEMSKPEKWAPHVSDGLDALAKAISKKELIKLSNVVAASWNDDKFKQRLMQDPRAALEEFGIEVPAGVDVRIVENTDKIRYVTLPPKPADTTELSERELRAIAGALSSPTSSPRLPQTWADTWVAITA